MANRHLQQEVIGAGEDQSCCDTTCSSIQQPQQYLRIATWPKVSAVLEEYATAYNSLNPEAPNILIDTIPSIRDLQDSIEITKASLAIDASARVDGYVVPPMLLGTLAEELASLEPLEENSELKYLPIYEHLTTVDGRKAALPLFSGNQLLLFYNKNIVGDLPLPNTWAEVANVAKALHNGPVSGFCLGRMSEEQCRQKSSQTGLPCHSQSMSYWSMVLASLAQSQGSSHGWLFHVNNNDGKITPLLNATMEPTLEILKEQVLYGATNALESDATMDLEAFRQGNCAMTILAEHPTDLLKDPNVGYKALPGSPVVLNRPPTALQECTFKNCPHGRINSNQQGEGVNMAPLGAMDIAMGAILESSSHQIDMQDFFNFLQFYRPESMKGRQPLTYFDLQALVENDPQMQEYADLIESATSDPNAVWPLTIPASFDLMSELDQEIYNYLSIDNQTAYASEDLVRKVDKTWGIRIQQQDSRMHSTPLSILYQRSLQGVAVEQTVDLYIGTGFRIAGWAMGGIACALSVGFAIWVYIYQDERVVRSSQPLFLWLICAGAFIMASCIFPFGIEDDIVSFEASSIACMSSMWLYGLGFVMLVSALYSKIWRINLIFRNQHKIRQIRILRKHIMVPFGLLFSINFVFLLIWTIVDPYEWIREEPNLGFTSGFCSSNHYRVFLALLVCINLLLASYTLIQAFECRKLSTEYDESLWIGTSLICIVQVWLIGLPILQITGSTPDWLFLTKVCVVFFTCVCTLLCIFVPKIRFLRKEAKEQEEHLKGGEVIDGSDRNSVGNSIRKNFQSAFGMIRFGSTNMVTRNSVQFKSSQLRKKKRSSGLIGIRIVRSSGEHTQNLERLQNNLKNAEARKLRLQDQLESLQEQLEQYIGSVQQPSHEAYNGTDPTSKS